MCVCACNNDAINIIQSAREFNEYRQSVEAEAELCVYVEALIRAAIRRGEDVRRFKR